MDKQLLEAAGIDYTDSMKRFGGNERLYEKVLEKFIQDDTMANLHKAIIEKDYKAADISLHTLKGVAGNLSMTTLYSMCSEALQHLRMGNYVDFSALLVDIDKAYCKVVLAISESQE